MLQEGRGGEELEYTQAVTIDVGRSGRIAGDLRIPQGATSVVVFAHGSGSSRLSPRNRQVARFLEEGGLATFLFDLLTPAEESVDDRTREYRFNIPFLAERLSLVTQWLKQQEATKELHIGYFGASTGGGAALEAAAKKQEHVSAVVSRGGRPDLASDEALSKVTAATLLLVGGYDHPVIGMNQRAYDKMVNCKEKQLVIIPKATHLFEEPGKLEEVCQAARHWFLRYLQPAKSNRHPSSSASSQEGASNQ
ncbi:Alpha/beta hydrolase [Balamuthia mandrillaris]